MPEEIDEKVYLSSFRMWVVKAIDTNIANVLPKDSRKKRG